MNTEIKFGKRVRFSYPTGRIASGIVQSVINGEIRVKYDPERFETRNGLTDRSRPIAGSGGYVTIPPEWIVAE